MIKILFVARYRDVTMSRKLILLAKQPDLSVWHVCPSAWQDELLRVKQTSADLGAYRCLALPMLGHPGDPHRALYRTLSFGVLRFRPDIIHAEEELDSLAALQIAAVRRVLAPRAKLLLHSWQNINRPKQWHVRWVFQTVLRACDGVMCASSEAAALLRAEGFRKPTTVLPAIGVDTETFVPVSHVCRDHDPFVVGYVGRIVQEKGLDTLLLAISQLSLDSHTSEVPDTARRPFRVVIVGDGAYRPDLAVRVQALGLADHISFLPPMPPSKVAEQIASFHALVLPSLTTAVWKEQFGRVLAEAMACSVPVVGSDSGAIPEVIGEGGLVFPEGDADALAACLRRLIASPALCHDLGSRGFDRVVHHYSQEHIAQQTAEWYRWIMAASL